MKRRKWWKALLCLLLALVLAAGGYAAYVLLAYYRVEDNQTLEIAYCRLRAAPGWRDLPRGLL